MVHYVHSCVVTLKATNCSVDGTGSGIIIDTVHGFVVTQASLLGAILLEDQHLQNVLITQELYGLSEDIMNNVKVELILEKTDSARSSTIHQDVVLSKYQSALVSSTIRKRNPDISTCSASIVSLFKCNKFESAMKHLTPQSSWKFSDIPDDNKSNEASVKEKDSADVIISQLLSHFILIKVHNWTPFKSALSIRSPQICQIGEQTEIVATPFGNQFPDVLVNSCSRGVISNMAGKNRCLILTDARCIPGSEGGPLYTFVDNNRYITGMIVTSLCWKNNEWIGLSLACSLDEILECLKRSDVLVTPTPNITSNMNRRPGSLGSVSAMFGSIPLIKVDNSWGSGIIIHHGRRLILTCSHVIKSGRIQTVYMKQKPNKKFSKCEVLWYSPPAQQFDLALLSYSSNTKTSQRQASAFSPALPIEGSLVYVVGHGVFGAEHNLLPSVTVGVVSKIITVNNIPVMIQTTCAVHPGASGGALIDIEGHLVGIVVCNAKDISSGACFPHVNMSIPMVTIWTILQKYCSSADATVLNNLSLKNPAVDDIWTFENQTSVNKFLSKL